MVGAIHGRLLTAWSVAGILGPVIINYVRDYQIHNGVPKAQAYSVTMYILAALLVVGFICNWLIKPTPAKYQMTPEQLEATSLHTRPAPGNGAGTASAAGLGASGGLLVPLAWDAVWIPIGWGVWMTLTKAAGFFR